MEKATGHYLAVKMIDKRLPLMVDYSRQLLVMAVSAKVCVLTGRGISPSFPSLQEILVMV